MSTNRFRGDAPAVAQVNTVTPASVTVGNIFTLTCNGKTINFTATAATVANVTAGLVAALGTTTIAEFLEVAAVENTTNLTLTAKTPGIPFVITSGAATGSGSGGCTLVTAHTVVSSGPNDISTVANWTLGALPVNTDDIIFDVPGTNAYWGLDALAAVSTPNSLTFAPTWDGICGLPDVNQTGLYYEYRQKFLQTLTTTITNNSQSGRVKHDSVTTGSVTFNQYAAGNPIAGESVAVNIKGTGASSVLNLMQGTVGVALEAGDTATFATVNIGSLTNPATDVNLTFGTGATLTTINQVGGVALAQSNITTWTQTQGTGTLLGSATLGTLNSDAGYLYWRSTGTMTTLNLGNEATLDRSSLIAGATITNSTLKAGAKVLDPGHKITWTNPTLLDRCGLEDVTIQAGKNIHVAIT